MTVRPDKRGKLQAFCLEDEGGCGLNVNLPHGRVVETTTAAELGRHADDIREFPAAYREHLARSWLLTTAQLEAIINGTEQPPKPPAAPGAVDRPPAETPGPAEPAKPGISAENPGPAEPAPVDPARPGPVDRATDRNPAASILDWAAGGPR